MLTYTHRYITPTCTPNTVPHRKCICTIQLFNEMLSNVLVQRSILYRKRESIAKFRFSRYSFMLLVITASQKVHKIANATSKG